jgi:nucleotide-binding universal stress UspA family protein
MMLSRVLIPLDGSETAEAILSQLRRILTRHESELILFQAQPLFPLQEGDDPEPYLRRITFGLTNEGFPSRYVLRPGLPADAILEAARSERATLIALSTHGRTGLARWALGSVAEKVLQSSPLPVLVARSFPMNLSRGKLESMPIRRFLIPLDGSRLSLDALQFVHKLARPVDARITLLHVDEPTPVDGRWNSPGETLKQAESILKEACVVTELETRKGDPAEEILKTAEEKKIDLIAMTTHGRSGLSRWVLGSVTAKVLRASPVPMLVIRHSAEKIASLESTPKIPVS